MIRRPPRSTQSRSSAASDVYKRQRVNLVNAVTEPNFDSNSYEVYMEYEIIGRELDSGPLTTELLLERTR